MGLEDSKGLRVAVTQKDGFRKYGKLVFVGDAEITLLFSDGRTNNISRDFIASWEVEA